jgi:VWFA-related protein
MLASARGKSDPKVAQMLAGLELTERLDLERVPALEHDLPGVESRRSLVLLADVSAFLHPPAAELPATAPPDLAAQRQIMSRVVDYAAQTIHKLPNFIATRDTIRFEDHPAEQNVFGSFLPYRPLHAVQNYSSTAYYRDGNEVEDATSPAGKKSGPPTRGLITSGEFGPILSTVLLDAAQGQVAWSHWELGKTGPLAVFRYRIPREKSHYQVRFCCVSGEGANGVAERFTGYQGEIAVDPESGAIFRITLRAELAASDKIARADMLVEYGTVDIGGQNYICPSKSISISVAPLSSMTYVRDATRFAPSALDGSRNSGLQTLLNDVVFDNYHVFRSEARMVAGDSAPASGAASERVPEPPASSALAPAAPAHAASAPEAATQPAASSTSIPSTSATDGSNFPDSTAAPAAPSPAAAVPEISEGTASGLPDIPGTASPAQGEGYRLQVTTRLVNVGVVPADKKGRPIGGLKIEDFEIYDNGRKQQVRFLSSPSALDESPQFASPPAEPTFSNHRADMDSAQAGAETSETSVTILLIDAESLAWKDLTYARQQMLRFLQTMPATERAGIYVQNAGRFQVLIEPSADRVRLVSALHQWTPDARNVAAAEEAERRNRQQIDDVSHVEDLQSVNGNINTSPDTTATADPQLRDFSNNSGGRGLASLVLIARHLAATPGRKNLVWVASENVLADWSSQAVSSDKGSKHLQGPLLRAQEALNDAHVSLYPLDASQLETQAVDPSLQNHNVELSPSVTAPPGAQSGGAAPGRITAELQQDLHPVQDSIRAMAAATGGRVFRRGGDFSANLNSVLQDGRASYLLAFVPDTPADDQYHAITVRLVSHHGVQLRYRTGYVYSKEPATVKDRFRQAVWQPVDANDIAISARSLPAFGGSAFKLSIAVNDLALHLNNGRWDGKLDIFAVQRTTDGQQAQISERQLVLSLLPETYQSLTQTGVPFDQFVESKPGVSFIRVIVVDESSGRIGSVTVPAEALDKQ